MLKAEEIDFKDTNAAHLGSKEDRDAKKDAAAYEPAWEGAGEKLGLQVWRIVQFKVEHWPKDQYGEFYDGDSYILLNTYKENDSEEFLYDVHFWIGRDSTTDEYATAAYKTVELDTLLDDKPIQHREVQGYESSLFKSYFPCITLLKGGAETGFRRVLPTVYPPRLIHVKREELIINGKKKKIINCSEIGLLRNNLNSDDVFIIDTGKDLYQYNGCECSPDEKYRACIEINKIKSSRGGHINHQMLEERLTSDQNPGLQVLAPGEAEKREKEKGEKKMFHVSDETGRLEVNEIARDDKICKKFLTDDDVYIINTGEHVFCWIGKGASIEEKRNGLTYASDYLNNTSTPWLPITVVSQGAEPEEFHSAF